MTPSRAGKFRRGTQVAGRAARKRDQNRGAIRLGPVRGRGGGTLGACFFWAGLGWGRVMGRGVENGEEQKSKSKVNPRPAAGGGRVGETGGRSGREPGLA